MDKEAALTGVAGFAFVLIALAVISTAVMVIQIMPHY